LNEILERVTTTVSRFFEKPTSAIGIDIGSSAIKVVQLKVKDGKAILETYGELSLGPYAELTIGQTTSLSGEKLGSALKDVMHEAEIFAKAAGIAIPLSASLITIIEMFYTKKGRLDEMIPLEARKYIPVPISEVSLDWHVIPSKTPEPSEEENSEETQQKNNKNSNYESTGKERKRVKVLLAAIHNEILNKYKQIADQNSLEVDFFEIEVFSSIRSLIGREREPVFILDIGSGTSKLLVVEDGIVSSSHIINRGSHDITFALAKSQGISTLRAEEMKREIGLSKDPIHEEARKVIQLVVEGIFADANRVVIDYEKKMKKPVTKIILSGGGSLLKGLKEIAQKNLEIEVVRADPFSKVESPAFLESVLKEAGPNFAVAVGVALRRLQGLG